MFSQYNTQCHFGLALAGSKDVRKIAEVKCASSGTTYYKDLSNGKTAWRRDELAANPLKPKK